ncbi:MAG: DUF2905 family protein [Leptospirillia bacterium]
MVRMLAMAGIFLLVLAGILALVERLGGRGLLSRFGHLPGDIVIKKPGMIFAFPLVSGLLLSLVLSLVLSLLFAFFRR